VVITKAGIILPFGITQRVLNQAQAAKYCDLSVNSFKKHIAPIVHPVPGLGRRKVWNVKALDEFLNKHLHSEVGSINDDIEYWIGRLDDAPSNQGKRRKHG
jgi:hypothetical protein